MNQPIIGRRSAPRNFKSRRSQGGYALIIGLILLLVMAIFGVTAMRGSMMQERMAGNNRDYNVAFEANEMALRWGESWLQSRTPQERPFPCQTLISGEANENCTDPRQILDTNLLGHDLEDRNPWVEYKGGGFWHEDNARPYGIDPATNTAVSPNQEIRGVKEQPLILMEQAFVDRDDLAGKPQQGRIFYRIHAAATGARASTVVVGQSSVAKRFE